jgi:hypothetical protein
MKTRSALFLLLRLFVAFLCGWILAGPIFRSLSLNSSVWIWLRSFLPDLSNISPLDLDACILLVFPLILGISAPLTVSKRNNHLVFTSIGTGLLVMAGVGAFWFPITSSDDAQSIAECAGRYCHFVALETGVLIYFLIYGVMLVLLSSVITSLIIKRIRKNRQKVA